MEEFDIKSRKLQKLESLKTLLQQGAEILPDLTNYLHKIDSISESIQDGEISIVLLGSFSDGKTSTIAGLLGRLEDNMRIDQDESSDELTIYRPKGLRKGFKIVDTPGLFGTKEREIDGKNVKFSQLTENYISEAHILIYVCDAVVPLKDSHVEILRRILRDYHKLDNTIFVINKMDEAGFDLLDEADFKRGCAIKKENLVSRLRSTINLTPDEEKRLNVVCIAADPKGKGLEYWFTKIVGYYDRSHIKDLRDCVNRVVDQSDRDELADLTTQTSIEDVLDGLKNAIDGTVKPVKKEIAKIERNLPEQQEDQEQLRVKLNKVRTELTESLQSTKDDICRDINGASGETIKDVIASRLGIQDGQVTFYVFTNKIQSLINECCETNGKAVDGAAMKLEKSYEIEYKALNEALAMGAKSLKNVTISGEQVKAVRDVIAKSYKFKPWGAINLGKNISKALGWIGGIITIALEIGKWIKRYEDEKKLNKLKEQLCSAVSTIHKEVLKTLNNDESYFKNYAPSYIEFCKMVAEKNQQIESLKQKINELEHYKERIVKWKDSAENAEYVEL